MVVRKVTKTFAKKNKSKGTVPKATKRYVKDILDKTVEDKQAGVLINSFNAPNTVSATLLNGIGQGVNQGQRIGMKIKLKKMVLRLAFNARSDIAVARGRIRMAVVIDKQANGADPVAAQLLAITTAGLTYISPRNANGDERYEWLYDRLFDVNVTGGAADFPVNYHLTLPKRLNRIVTYGGTDATAASINTGSLYLLTMSQNDQGITVSGACDIRYEDA